MSVPVGVVVPLGQRGWVRSIGGPRLEFPRGGAWNCDGYRSI